MKSLGTKLMLLKQQLTDVMYRNWLGGWSQQIEKERAELEKMTGEWEREVWREGYISGWLSCYKGDDDV